MASKMAHPRRDYGDDNTAANLLRSVREQEHQYQKLTKELEEERKNVALQLQRCNYNSETASVCSMGSSTDDSFVWRGQGPGSVASEEDFTDDESRMSGSALVDSCLKVLQERGLSDSRDDQDPLYSRKNKMEPQEVTGQSNSLVSQDWEKELMDADLTPGGRGQTVKKVVTRTEVRTVRTIDGRIVQDEYDPGMEHTQIYGGKAINGEGPSTPTKRYVHGDEIRSGKRSTGSQSSVEGYQSPRRGLGSQSSVEEYRSPRGYGGRGGYGSADEGGVTPTRYGDTGYMSDSYAVNRGPRSQSAQPGEPQYVRTAVATTSMSLPRSQGPPPGPRGPGPATMPRTSSAGRPTTTYNLSIKVGDVKGSGTDGNVYIQLFGEKGNTAKIQLRQAGDNRNRFEKGRTYKFTVDTVDIGKVDRIKLSHDHTGYGSGFYVEEVEIEIPERQDKVKFPCRCWLAQGIEDGKIEREMFPVPQLPNTSYTMSVKLGEVLSPDTNLHVQLFGEKGETSKIMLRPVGTSFNRFEKGRTYKFTVETVDIGKIDRLRIGHDARGPGKGIYVEEVDVQPAEGERTTFPCACWLAEDKADKKLERDVLPGKPKPPRPNVSYHLAIKTADVPNAGSDANVYFQLIGDEAETEKIQLRQGGKSEKRFERGRTDKFIVETVDVGPIQRLRIGHDNKGLAAGWKLDQVIVEVPSRGEKHVFPCNRWLDTTEDDKQIERELAPGVPGAMTTTTTTTSSGPPTPSRTVSKTVIEKTTTSYRQVPTQKKMDEDVNKFDTAPKPVTQKQVVDETRYKTMPPKTVATTEEVRYQTTPTNRIIEKEVRHKKPIPTPDKIREERIRMELESRPESVPPPRPAPPVETVDQGDMSLRSYQERQGTPGGVAKPKGGYTVQTTTTETITREIALEPEQPKIVAYQLCLKMGDIHGDGTEGNVFIQLVGSKGMTEKIMLRQDGNSKIKFEKGRTYKFTIETVDIGPIEKVVVSHDGEPGRGGWYLEEVTVDVPSRDEHVVFPCMSWLDAGEGDGKTVRELNAKPAVYHLKIKTGNQKNAGTKANVWTCIHGDKADTGRIELERSGIMESLFEPDQTDYFTISASDIGKVEAISVGHDGDNKPGTRWYLEEIVLNSPHKGEHYIFPCKAWIPEADGKKADVQLVPQAPLQNYSIMIKTGNRKNAGTDSNVYMQIFGDRGDTGVVELKQVCEPTGMLQKGSTFQFPMQTTDVGNLEKVRIGHDGKGLGTGWFLEEVIIMVHDECWVFPCNRWLADYEDDGKTERDLYPERKTYAHEPDLQDLIEYLQTDDINLIVNSAFYLQHLCYNDEAVKAKIRELGGIPVLVRLLDHEVYSVHRAAASCLRNVSYSKERDENKLAIAECNGIEALMRLLQKTPKDEVKELVLGVLWNLSSCDILKIRIIQYCLIILVRLIIIPYSGWDKEIFQSGKPIPSIKWSTVFRNASGILRNLSSAGVDARKEMRACEGLVDSLVWILYAPIGKSDVDNKSVENSVCTLRNLSYRLEDEVDREKYEDAPAPPPTEEKKSEVTQPGCMAACGGTKKGKHVKEQKEERPPAEGVELLWQPEIVKPYLSIMAESSNPDTLEGVAGALHNLMACNWKWAILIRSAVRKEKGLPIMVELLRMDHDPVVRAVATCLRNLAIDPRNKELIGKFAMKDLIRQLPDPKDTDTEEGPIDNPAVGPLLCAIHQIVNKSLPNGKHCRDKDGFRKIVAIAKSKDKYSPKIVKTANQVLMTLWQFTALRNSLKKEGWELTKEVTDEFGPPTTTPKAFDEVSLPRNSMRNKNRIPETVRSDESTIPDPPIIEPPPSQHVAEDGYEADDDKNRNRPIPRSSPEEIEMHEINGSRSPPAYESDPTREEPQYAQVDKSKKKKIKGAVNSDSWV